MTWRWTWRQGLTVLVLAVVIALWVTWSDLCLGTLPTDWWAGLCPDRGR